MNCGAGDTYTSLGTSVVGTRVVRRTSSRASTHDSEYSSEETSSADVRECLQDYCDHHCRLREHAVRELLWERYSHQKSPDVFGYHNLRISSDSGLDDVSKLLYKTQYYYALSRVLGVILNCYVVASVDLRAITGVEEEDPSIAEARQKFLLTAAIACVPLECSDDSTVEDKLHTLIPILELVYMFGTILVIIVLTIAVQIARHCKKDARNDLFVWRSISYIFWEFIQELESFSALKILYHVTPLVFGTRAYLVVVNAMETHGAAMDRIWACICVLGFFVSRLLILVIGFDAFLVKFRIVSEYVDNGNMTAYGMLQAAMFLFQVMGAVKIAYFLRERFSIFIFGGQDGELNQDELLLKEVWEALLVRQIYTVHGAFNGSVIMLAFDDYDFQQVVLDDDETDVREREATAMTDVLEIGTRVRVKLESDSHLKGEMGIVTNPSWKGLVKVQMDGASNGVKSFKQVDLEVLEEDE